MNVRCALAVLLTPLFTLSASAEAQKTAAGWVPAPYLMLDDTLIDKTEGVSRTINSPSRLPDPIVTSYEDGNFQPWITVIRDPQTRRFRMWYNVPETPGNKSFSSLAHIESEDGIHWQRPHRVLKTPKFQFGASVIDEGPDYREPSQRFKFASWYEGGLRIAASPDGLEWTSLADGNVVLRADHDVTAIDRDPIRGRYMALVSNVPNRGPYKSLRIPYQSVSDDLLNWKKPSWEIVRPDPDAVIERGETQFYGMSAAIARGRLLVSMVKVLRDDLNCEPGKTAKELHDDSNRPFAGIGYTVLAWSQDGENWKRDTEPFLDRNPQSGTWDRAMAWVDDQIVVGDYTYIYYGGYRWGHKAERHTERQVGFAQMYRDRYVGYDAEDQPGRLLTQSDILKARTLKLNARLVPAGGELRVRLLDEHGKPYPGYDWDDCAAIIGDRVDHLAVWQQDLAALKGKPVRFEFRWKRGTLYSFELE